jgi:uncharacterized protein (TIGR02145 family)
MLKICEAGKFVLASAMVVIMAGSAVGNIPPALAGRWVPEDGGKTPGGFPNNMELLKDGTGIVDGSSRSWKTEGNRIYFMGAKAFALNYKVSGSTLILTNDDGKAVTYLTQAAAKKIKEAKDAAAIAVKTGADTLPDSRDGKKYKTVKAGGKTWMAENLNYQTGNSWCYNNNTGNCSKYGRLYDCNTAKTACPSGWHLPSRQEWNALTAAAGDSKTASKKLKAASGWNNNGNGTDDLKFSALPGGNRRNDGRFYGAGNDGSWWTATESKEGNGDLAYYRGMHYGEENVYEFNYDWGYGFSVRCVAD